MAEPEPAVYAGERIRAARTLISVSQAELGDSVGVTQTWISHMESGRRPVPADLLNEIAASTGQPRSFFDAVPMDLPPLTLRFRKQAKAKKVETRRAEQLLAETYRIAWQLVNARPGFIPPALPVATGDVLGPNEIEDLATRVRETLGVENTSPVRNVTRALERSGIAVVPLVVSDDDESETVGHFGASCWPGGSDPAVVGFFQGGSGDRQRFTLAHELGHLVLHTRRRFVKDPEDEANRFAGAFLVPSERASDFISADTTLRDFAHLKAAWGVSIQALIMRCSQLGLIDPARKTSLFKQLTARGWRRSEPVAVGHETPVLFGKLVASRFGSGMRGCQRAANELGLSPLLLATLVGLDGKSTTRADQTGEGDEASVHPIGESGRRPPQEGRRPEAAGKPSAGAGASRRP